MNCSDIIRKIEEDFPLTSAEDWDNSGFLAGRRDRDVKKIMVALDANDEVIEKAVQAKADLLITHHPMIFGSIKSVTTDTFIGNRIITLIENGISYYAMHTNYDVCAMADLNADMLGLTETEVLAYTGEDEGLGRVGTLKEPMNYYDFAAFVKKVFELPDVRCYGDGNAEIRTAAICSGSGKSLIGDALASGADVFVTGDIDYHTGTDAWAKGLRIIDAGHYGTEHCFENDMQKRLMKMFPELEVVRAQQTAPYKLI